MTPNHQSEKREGLAHFPDERPARHGHLRGQPVVYGGDPYEDDLEPPGSWTQDATSAANHA